MARYTGPKAKRARALGEALTNKDAKILMKRNYAPGQHGQSKGRVSEYGTQLKEKQKAKWTYGILERQFRKYFAEASKKKGVTGETLLRILEQRLDNIVYRLGLAESRAQARQIVSHGFITVNGKRVDIPSYRTKVGDLISISQNKQKSKYVDLLKQKLKNAKTQEWLSLNADEMNGKVLSVPTPEQIDNKINTQLIVELYSR
ncbi:30S ribosomal protein S4 [Patescibacteria group bacterium]|nr:30S ribosomal protein S4 [Patescibacteria group bacterium]